MIRIAHAAFFVFTLFVVCASPGIAAIGAREASDPGASLPSAITAKIDSVAEKTLADMGVPSASLSLVKGGRLVYNHAYGKARLEPPVVATPQMRYEIGSVSKQFTAAAMLLLQQEGKLHLDDPVSKYLPDLTSGGEITLRMVLSHTSGYEDYWPQDYVMLPVLKPVTTAYILDTWAKKPLDFSPGTRWQYSNTNYVIAAAVIEKISGEPYFKFIQDRILTPLAMNSAINMDTGEVLSADAEGYYRHALGPLRPAPKEGRGWMFGAFELAMTAGDLSLWNISVIDRKLLRPDSYDQMFRPFKLKDGTETRYGLGVFVTRRDGHLVISHSGESSGFVAENDVFPDDHMAIAVLTNEDAVGAASVIARQIAPLLLGNDSTQTASSPVETEVQSIFAGLEDGKIDRSRLTSNCSAYFSQQALDDFASSLKPLGAPTAVHLTREEQRGGMTQRVFTADFGDRHLSINTYVMPDGKYEQYLVAPAN